MEFIKAKYFAFFFMLVLLTSGFPLNANNDGDILPTADATVKAANNGHKIFFCENNPIKKTEYNKPHMKPQDYMSKCIERTDGFSWGSRIYVLIWAPGFNTDEHKIDELGTDSTGSQGLIKLNSRDGSSRSDSSSACNPFIETGIDHGLFYGSIKLSGFRTAVNDAGTMNYGGNRCEGTGWGAQGTLDDGVLRAEAGQDGGITMTFEYAENQIMSKSATHTWRISDLSFDADEYEMGDTAKITISDLDNLRYPFDKKTPYLIHLYSDSDQAGVEVDAYWKANYRGTPQMKGEYPVNITFIDPDRRESTSNSNLFGGADGSRAELKVVPGDNIYAEYFDRTLPAYGPNGEKYSTEDKLKITTVAKIVEIKDDSIERKIVDVKDDSHAKQFAFTKYTSNGEYLVSVWWDQWDWWINQPSSQPNNDLNISIVEGLTEKPVDGVSYTVNVSSNDNSLLEQEIIHAGTDTLDVSLDNTNFIEIEITDIGEVSEILKFKFNTDDYS